jgi:hypothetical protein
MIYESLKFLAEEVNKYLNVKLPNPTPQARLVVSNISLAADTGATINPDPKDKIVLSLVNVEEDKVARQQENYTKSDLTTVYKNPPLYLNLYILFSMNRNKYDDNLVFLGSIVQFFQHQNVFSPITHPGLDSRIQRLVVDMYNLNFEQSNHLWSVMGGKYFPSVMYKIRQVSLDENLITGESGFIKEVQVNDKLKMPVT